MTQNSNAAPLGLGIVGAYLQGLACRVIVCPPCAASASSRVLQRLSSALLLLTCLFALQSFGQAPPPGPPLAASAAEDSVDKDYRSELPRIEPKSPEEALKCFEVIDGFRVELVAAEPLVFDPIAFAFDARRRLFVVEMRDYSEQETDHLGSIALLEDTDADGRMDKRSTFVDGLSWPTALWPWKDGVLVAEPPRITWYRDTDNDGRSDLSEDWFTGFDRGNVQGLVNSLRWGVDSYLHGATSSSGADVQPLQGEAETPLELRRRDFGIDPVLGTIHAEAGGGQHGLSFNCWGDKFVTSNSDHLQQIIDLEWWLATHASNVPLPSTRRSIATDGPQAEVFRASPVEPWRIVRTRLRLSGIAPGIVEGGGRAAGYFTGATGTWIMDRDAGFGEANHDTAIVCDVGSNLVHRKRLIDEGLFWSGERIDDRAELLRSSDTWFRPVQLGDGPGGELIIADMYREVIEHPKSLPPMIKQHLDLTSGRDRGRIWRLVPDQWQQVNGPDLADLSSSQLVERLSHPVAWQRRMASQLLVQRQANDVRAELHSAAVDVLEPEAQVLAMHVASRLGMFTVDLAKELLQSNHPRVLQHAIHLIGKNHLASQLPQTWVSVLPTNVTRVQLELAMLASDCDAETRERLLSTLFAQVDEPLVQAIVANAAADSSWKLFDLAAENMAPSARDSWLELLLPIWARQIPSDPALRSWIAGELTSPRAERAEAWLSALSSAASFADASRILASLTQRQRQSLDNRVELELEAALEQPVELETRFRLVRLVASERQRTFAEQLLEPTRPEAAQRAAIDLVSWRDDREIAELVLSRFSSLTPALQADALRALAERQETLQLLAAALERQDVRSAQIPLEIRAQLLRAKDEGLASRFKQLLGTVSADRQAVIERYASSLMGLATADDTVAGREVFRRVCAQCHQLGSIGNDVGPPLKQLGDKSAQQLLEIILDPNREIDAKYAAYTILLTDGRVLSGIIQDESAGQVILKEAGGKHHTIARSDIDQIKNTGVSLMPVGLEESIAPREMMQLIQFLKTETVDGK